MWKKILFSIPLVFRGVSAVKEYIQFIRATIQSIAVIRYSVVKLGQKVSDDPDYKRLVMSLDLVSEELADVLEVHGLEKQAKTMRSMFNAHNTDYLRKLAEEQPIIKKATEALNKF